MISLDGKHLFRVFAVTMILLAATAYAGRAALFVQTKIATGTVTALQDKVITLDNGISYYPASPRIRVTIGVGKPVTLRYYRDADGKYLYTQVAAGENSLLPVSPPARKSKGMK